MEEVFDFDHNYMRSWFKRFSGSLKWTLPMLLLAGYSMVSKGFSESSGDTTGWLIILWPILLLPALIAWLTVALPAAIGLAFHREPVLPVTSLTALFFTIWATNSSVFVPDSFSTLEGEAPSLTGNISPGLFLTGTWLLAIVGRVFAGRKLQNVSDAADSHFRGGTDNGNPLADDAQTSHIGGGTKPKHRKRSFIGAIICLNFASALAIPLALGILALPWISFLGASSAGKALEFIFYCAAGLAIFAGFLWGAIKLLSSQEPYSKLWLAPALLFVVFNTSRFAGIWLAILIVPILFYVTLRLARKAHTRRLAQEELTFAET